ncbi:MAG: T9SS type A sorting domain-containing protein [Vicingaceae bacterium]
MKKFLFIFLFSGLCSALLGQDYLSAPKVNPSLFKQVEGDVKANSLYSRLKSTASDDSVIYRFDTLDLPFIDDFSKDHLLKPFSPSRDTYSDTTVYRIIIGGSVYRDTAGLLPDSTFTYQIGQDCTILQRTLNILGFAELYNINSYPPTSVTIDFFAHHNIYDTINGGSDTVEVEPTLFQDSANYYFVDLDTSIFYTDRDVLLNSTFPIFPPSIGVVSFDGLDQNGLPYDLQNPRRVEADFLTSVPLRMGNLPDTNVYISFFVQPKGISLYEPAMEDSLTLDFYNPTTEKWVNLWGTGGYSADTFQQVMVKVPNTFLQDGTQFRFRAYANSSGAFDHWHLDYIYLNAGRSPNDTNYRDIAYVYPGPSFLKEFQAMPYWHFQDDPSAYMFDEVDDIWIKNNFDNAFNVYNKVLIPDTVNNLTHYRYPAGNEVSIILGKENYAFSYPIDFDFQSNQIDSAGVLKAVYDIRFDVQQPSLADIIRSNDTCYSKAVLDNYYAYDDGTAEAGYGVNPDQNPDGYFSFMAVEFNQPFVDSIGGMQIYFLPQNIDVRNQTYKINVWGSSQFGGPGELIYSVEKVYNPIYTDDNGYLTHWFDTLLEVEQRYYVGIESIGRYSLNVGYDMNNNHRDRIFWSFDAANWYNPSSGIQDGSLMIRPLYRKSNWGVGLNENAAKTLQWSVFPNPAKDEINIDFAEKVDLSRIQLIDMSGRVFWETTKTLQRKVNVASYPNGIYILRVIDDRGVAAHKKIIISHE